MSAMFRVAFCQPSRILKQQQFRRVLFNKQKCLIATSKNNKDTAVVSEVETKYGSYKKFVEDDDVSYSYFCLFSQCRTILAHYIIYRQRWGWHRKGSQLRCGV